MFVFNCTVAAAHFVNHLHSSQPLITQPPHNSIADCEHHTQAQQVSSCFKPLAPWHWLVDVTNIKGQRYLLFMEYHHRFCVSIKAPLSLPLDQLMEQFQSQLKASLQALATTFALSESQAEWLIQEVKNEQPLSRWHQRIDLNVKQDLDEVIYHLQKHISSIEGHVQQRDLIEFSLFSGNIVRSNPQQDDYFSPNERIITDFITRFEELRPKSRHAHTQQQMNISAKHSDKDEAVDEPVNNVICFQQFFKRRQQEKALS